MDKFKTVAELTLLDLQELLDSYFESYVLTAKYNDPNLEGEQTYTSIGKGLVYEQVALLEFLKDELEDAREESRMMKFYDEDDDDS